jgi:hypothetical protein
MNLDAEAWGGTEKGFYRMRCRRCGEYEITDHAYQDIEEQSPFLQAAARQEFEAGRRLRISNDNLQRLIAEHSSTDIPQNTDKLLNFISRRCRRPGNSVQLDPNLDYPIIDAEHSGELAWHLGGAVSAGYIEQSGAYFALTAKGWDHLFGGTGTGAIPGRCFVAMSFDDDHSAIYTEGIKPALQAAGYDAVWMKDVLTNEDINYRMVAEIRKSQFLVADFTGLKAGVYFEAGFALGLGRNVFWTTNASDLPKIHFDTNHYQHIVWKTHDELRDQLREKIIALLGFGPRKTPE